jgi:predicted N-acetyltransferase YhbS
VAVDTREAGKERIVGALRVVGDGVRCFYIQDVMVLPEFQHQRIGSAMMESIMHWLRRTASKGAFVGLFTGKPAFYEPYGFEGGYGMCVYL